ncbi:(2Fe-2S)-binding protein [Pigmentiphaga sp. H8]|uniref:2Fe-2S iron-sulfur cluster-binding protein n=1 Tax=unclassified Pigmentiphaga TaxID=2626614 RepID=UPI000F598DB9|nr:2Fe-2S iron-sulfur cluster-binding protein [Pigmentiphaga sp. H8]AZG07688.1 (2Fe-2S)-binding protein [Pigmentiphaga sp. H8]
MPEVHLIQPGGLRVTLDVPVGTSIMQAAVSAGVAGILAECGGSCMCATCHVYAEEAALARLPPVQPAEHEMLACTADERRPNSRLSCQVKMTDDLAGLSFTLPEIQ